MILCRYNGVNSCKKSRIVSQEISQTLPKLLTGGRKRLLISYLKRDLNAQYLWESIAVLVFENPNYDNYNRHL